MVEEGDGYNRRHSVCEGCRVRIWIADALVYNFSALFSLSLTVCKKTNKKNTSSVRLMISPAV